MFWAPLSSVGFEALAPHPLFAFTQRWVQVPGLRLPPESLPIANLVIKGGHPLKALPAELQSLEPVPSTKASPLSPCVTEPALRAKLGNLVR